MSRGKILHHTYEMLKSLWSQPDANWEANSEFIEKLTELKASQGKEETTPYTFDDERMKELENKNQMIERLLKLEQRLGAMSEEELATVIKAANVSDAAATQFATLEKIICGERKACEIPEELFVTVDTPEDGASAVAKGPEPDGELVEILAKIVHAISHDARYWTLTTDGVRESFRRDVRWAIDLIEGARKLTLVSGEMKTRINELERHLHDMDTRFAVAFETLEKIGDVTSAFRDGKMASYRDFELREIARETLAKLKGE